MVRDAERELPGGQRARRRVPGPFARTYPLAPAVDEVVAAIAERRRRVAYPKWFLKLLPVRQAFGAKLLEREAAKEVPEAEREYARAIAERGASAAAATERTRELAGL